MFIARGRAGDVCVLVELEAEGGGNIKQELCVLSSHRLDRTPPKHNEVFFFVSGSPTQLCTHIHIHYYTFLKFEPPREPFLNVYI